MWKLLVYCHIVRNLYSGNTLIIVAVALTQTHLLLHFHSCVSFSNVHCLLPDNYISFFYCIYSSPMLIQWEEFSSLGVEGFFLSGAYISAAILIISFSGSSHSSTTCQFPVLARGHFIYQCIFFTYILPHYLPLVYT